MNNPFNYTPDTECQAAFRTLSAQIDALKESTLPAHRNLCTELDAGKMLGILIAADAGGERHTLYAFSGQLGSHGFHFPGFVEPVFDYLDPRGHFKTHEADISRQNREIADFENEILPHIRSRHHTACTRRDTLLDEHRALMREGKLRRENLRRQGVSAEQQQELIRQSQHEKAELQRLKKQLAANLEPLAAELRDAELRLSTMKEKRRADSERLQQWLFNNFRLLNARGETRSLTDIFADTPLRTPPSGAGECCAPKLLQAAYRQGLTPLAIAEYWYGAPKEGELRIHGQHYPACRGKCLPVLGWMLQGLEVTPPLDTDLTLKPLHSEPEIIFENEWFCVVDKPAGMLSVPGKGAGMSLQQWLCERNGANREVRMAHRLDQDTSGLIIATFTPEAYKLMQQLFATRKVRKTYEAILDGDYRAAGIPPKGCITLYLAPDILDRPRQRVDPENGKEAVTDYEFTDVSDGVSRILFHPHTGRTHQLRVSAASPAGLGLPILGDPLYGKSPTADGHTHGHTHPVECAHVKPNRLHLHARTLEFTFPHDSRSYIFHSKPQF